MTSPRDAAPQRNAHIWRRSAEVMGSAIARPRPIRDHLLLLVLVAVLPLLAFSAFALRRVASAERAQYEQLLRNTALDLAVDIDRSIDGMIVTLRSMSTSSALQSGDFRAFHAQATAALFGTPFGLVLLDPSRQALVNTLVPYGTPLPQSGDTETPGRVLNSRRPEVSNLFVGALLKRPVLNVDVPVIIRRLSRISIRSSR